MTTETKDFTVRWEGALAASPQAVWDAITKHADGYLWAIEYEPWVGGAERGLTVGGGTVTAYDEPRHFATRTRPEHERDGHNALDYRLEPLAAGTYLRYEHRGTLPADGFDRELAACRHHTAFYNHSLGQYACHFAGREPRYVSADGPEHSSFAAVKRALGVPAGAVPGDRVRLTPAGLASIDGVVDYSTPHFLGVRSDDALYRVYGRDAWGWPVSVAHHLFGDVAPDVDDAWSQWIADVRA